jgi:alanyl-tRNA synthetase
MTERLYYHDSSLHEFTARIQKHFEHDGRTAIVLDKTAFYPTSGGQLFDTGSLETDGRALTVVEVSEDENGEILHFIAKPESGFNTGTQVNGSIDAGRRREHMQQHSGQHVLSAAFVELFQVATVSFHMGAESCTIDLGAPKLSRAQLEKAEELANRVVTDDRPVEVRFATADQARQMGVRKLPPFETEGGKFRLVDIQNFDLTACGGTHVSRTGQIGAILLRKVEKVKQGMRVEFVCGARAVQTSRRDHAALTEAAGVYSTHIWEVPQQIRRTLDDAKTASKRQQALLEELAELLAAQLVSQAQPQSGRKIIVQVMADRDAAFAKLLAQKIAKHENAVALLASTAAEPTLVFAQSPGLPFNMGALMKQAVTELGGRGGGGRDFAQGGADDGANIAKVLAKLASELADPIGKLKT